MSCHIVDSWCQHVVCAALSAAVQAVKWMPRVGGFYGVVHELSQSSTMKNYGWCLAKVTKLHPLTVHWHHEGKKNKWAPDVVEDKDQKSGQKRKRSKANEYPHESEICMTMLLPHEVRLTKELSMPKSDTQVVLGLFQVWWDENMPEL